MSPSSRRANRAAWGVVVALGLLVAACTGDDATPADSTSKTTATTAATPTTTTSTSVPPGPGRLVITDDRGRVVVMDPDGSNADVLTEADGLSYFQPTWSPDGDLIAAGHGGGSENGLVVIDTTNGGFDVAPSVGVPFYFFWSPDSAKLAFLNNGSDGRLELNLRDVAGATTDRFGTGAPFYFSWSPDGESIATHIGTDIMDIRSLGGDTESLAAPGVFQAPQWTDRGLFHIGLTGDTQRLLLTAGETGSLGEVRGRTIFSATRDGSRIAVSSFSDQDGVSIAARPGRLTQTEQVLPANRLIVLDVESGEWKTVTTEPVAAFFWSPNGSRLLVLGRGDLELSVEWSVWDGQLTGYGSFVPSPSFIQNLVPFFDQYAQSFTLWSPDGGSFAYPAATDGDPGIWIQKVEGGDPTRVGNGSWVSWSSG